MGFMPIVYCEHCGMPLDVWQESGERFCSDDCREAYAEEEADAPFSSSIDKAKEKPDVAIGR